MSKKEREIRELEMEFPHQEFQDYLPLPVKISVGRQNAHEN